VKRIAGPRLGPRPLTVRERFESHVDRSGGPDACHIWRAGVAGFGYGRFRVDGKTYSAHRVAWSFVNGDVPRGVCILHACDVPACVNDAHLFTGSRAENMADMDAKGRRVNGRVYRGELHSNSKLTWATVERIRSMHARGATHAALASMFGVGRSSIGRVIRGEQWVTA